MIYINKTNSDSFTVEGPDGIDTFRTISEVLDSVKSQLEGWSKIRLHRTPEIPKSNTLDLAMPFPTNIREVHIIYK